MSTLLFLVWNGKKGLFRGVGWVRGEWGGEWKIRGVFTEELTSEASPKNEFVKQTRAFDSRISMCINYVWSYATENLTVVDVMGLFISPKKKSRCQSSSSRIQVAFVFLFHCPYHVACILISADRSLHLQPHIHDADRSQGEARSGSARISKTDTSPENPGRLLYFVDATWPLVMLPPRTVGKKGEENGC